MNGTKVTSEQLQDVLDGCWTIKEVAKKFHVTPMTIHNWRNYRELPVIMIRGDKRDDLRFVPAEVVRWARDNKVRIYGKTGVVKGTE